MADYSACFHEKFMQKKSIIIYEIQETCVCAHKFTWFAKKVACTTYDVLGILALISGTIFIENIFVNKSKTASFSAFFLKE